MKGALRRRADTTKFAIDAVAWAVAVFVACWARLEFRLDRLDADGIAATALIAVATSAVAGFVLGLYRGAYRYGGFDEVGALAKAAVIVTAVTFVAIDVAPGERLAPRGAVILAGAVALVLTAGARYAYRVRLHQSQRPGGSNIQRLLVFGAGEGAYQIVSAMLRDPSSPYLPVALLDDDPHKRHRRLAGVPVIGTRSDLVDAADAVDADAILIAIPSAKSDLITDISELVEQTDLPVMVLPPVSELIGVPGIGDIRTVTPADVLGRHQVETDVDAIAGYVTGRRVLVTGAGGSIGSELCRQLHRFGPAELMMLDRDESALHGVQLSMEGRALLDSPSLILMDVRDRLGLGRLFAERRPEVVFHAAALKHLPLLERHPGEAVKTNVWGTLALLEAAVESGVERFVNISTDKAADPTSVLGYSKRVCERLTTTVAHAAGAHYLSVRFGNVLGSRGSMLETFQRQVDIGGPITVTHPEVTRYFMTVEEAVQLVIQAGAIGEAGEVLVLDMGEPVKIVDVANMVAEQSKRKIEIVFTGLRDGEKLHEDLIGAAEDGDRRVHPLIQHVDVPGLDTRLVQALNPMAPEQETIDMLRRLALEEPQLDLTAGPRSRGPGAIVLP